MDASLRQPIFAMHLDLETQAEFVPGKAHVGEILPLLHGREVIDPARLGQIQQTVGLLSRNTFDVTARIGDAEQETMRN